MIKILNKILNCLCAYQDEKRKSDIGQNDSEHKSSNKNRMSLNFPETKKEFILDLRLSPRFELSKSTIKKYIKNYKGHFYSLSAPADHHLNAHDKCSEEDLIKLIEVSRHESSK